MPFYMTQFAYTPEAWAALVDNPEDRSAPVRELTESMGGRLVSWYLTSFLPEKRSVSRWLPDPPLKEGTTTSPIQSTASWRTSSDAMRTSSWIVCPDCMLS